MENVVRVGIGVMIIDNGKVLLGHYLVENKKCLRQCLKVPKEK